MGAVVGLLFGCGLVLVGAWAVVPRGRRPTGRRSRLGRLLIAAGVPEARAPALVGASVAAAVFAFAAMVAITRALPVAVVFAVLAGQAPISALRARARRRRREFAEVWPEAVDAISSGVRAGLSLAEAVGSLGLRGPEPLRPAFADFALDHQITGRFDDSLSRLSVRLADPVGDRVVEALRLAAEVGGSDLGRLLRGLSQFLREDARTRAELEARQAWAVNGARLAAAAPWLVLMMLSFQPEVIRSYATPAGALVLTIGGVCCAAAYLAMTRIGRLPRGGGL